MYKKFLHACFAVLFIGLFVGCHSKIDLENINKQAEAELGVAMPVGTLHVSIGDFLGTGTVSNICLDENGLYHFIDTVDIPTKHYHEINIKKYILENEDPQQFPIKPAVDNKSVIDESENYVLTFDLSLSTKNFTKQDPKYERIDEVWVNKSTFTSTIKVEDFDLKWSEIKKVELVLGKQFTRDEGKTIEIPVSGYGYNQSIPISVTNFKLNMADSQTGKTAEEVYFQIKFYVRPAAGHNIDVYDSSQFSYALTIGEIDYQAIWGFFEAGKDMRDAETLSMDSLWEDWKNIKKLKVRFMEPKVDVYVTHQIAAPLIMHLDYLRAVNEAGVAGKAQWTEDGLTKDSSVFALANRLDPKPETIGQTVTNQRRFSQRPEEGHIDSLFNVRPDSLIYSFWLSVDRNAGWKQHRIVKDDNVRGYANVDVPFRINTGSEMEYSTTLEDVNISNISLDSILASVEVLDSVKASDVKLIMEIENGLPFKVEGEFTFLNARGEDMKMVLLEDHPDNHLLFPAPEMTLPAGQTYGYVSKPSVTRCIVSIDKNDFNRLSEVKSIRMDVAMVDNPMPCQIMKDTDLRVRIGLAAHVDAVLNFDRQDNTNNQ